MCKCANVQMCKCANVQMCKCANSPSPLERGWGEAKKY